MQDTLSALLDGFDAYCFQKVYQQFSPVEFHPFTSDNQDYLAYICLVTLGGVADASQLAQAVLQGQYASFEQFMAEMDGRQGEMPPSVGAGARRGVRLRAGGRPHAFQGIPAQRVPRDRLPPWAAWTGPLRWRTCCERSWC